MKQELLAIASLAFLPSAAHDHGGGLDANGCHTERKTGNYHCHGGGSAGGGGAGGSSPATPPRRSTPKPSASPANGSAALISVGDGDTIRVTTSNGQKVTVRLACIDAPETAQGQSGADATQGLKYLLGSGSLEIRPQTIDKYGRTVAEVYAGGRNVNLELVREGLLRQGLPERV